MIDEKESMTAKLCSFARAYHSNFVRQKIFDDYLAFDLMGKEEYDEIKDLIQRNFSTPENIKNSEQKKEHAYKSLHKYISPIPLSRIAYAESSLKEFSKKHKKCQYIICGAGMDTFAFRNSNTDIKIFELDHPDTQRYKMERIEYLCWNIPSNVKYVPINFEKEDLRLVLEKAGFDPEIPSFFAILGVTYYLTLDVFEKTIEKISHLSTAESKVVFDYPDETTFHKDGAQRVKDLTRLTASLGEPMQQGFTTRDLTHMLNRHQFMIENHMNPDSIQKKFFENRSDGQKAFENIHFISAQKTHILGEL